MNFLSSFPLNKKFRAKQKRSAFMPKITRHPVSDCVKPNFKASGIKIKKYATATAFKKDLKKFLARNHVFEDQVRKSPGGGVSDYLGEKADSVFFIKKKRVGALSRVHP
jgi:hypothetical protein